MSKKRKNIPYWAKRKISCPDCGFVLNHIDQENLVSSKTGFDCPKCDIHYTYNDFWEEQYFKYSYEIVSED